MNQKNFFSRWNWKSNWKSIKGSGITLTNNKIKDIVKGIKYLENKETSFKETTKKITSQEGGFVNFLRPLMTVGLLLTKNCTYSIS